MRAPPLILAVVLLGGCDRGTQGAAPTASPAPSTHYAALPTDLVAPAVLVRAGSYLYTQPPPAGQRARNPRWPVKQRPDERWASRYALVRDGGAWLEVESAPIEPRRTRHCKTTSGYFGDLTVRVFVAREDVAPVLSRSVASDFEDGTRVELRAGVPVSEPVPESAPAGTSKRVASFDGFALPLAIPDDAVGYAYGEPKERAPSETTPDALDVQTDLTLDGHAWKQAFTSLGEAGLDGLLRRRVFAREERGGVALVDLESSCARYRVRVPPSAIVPAVNSPPEDLGVRTLPRRAYRVKEGASLTWTDGSPAGVARAAVWLEEEGFASGTRRCFEFKLDPDSPPDTPEASLVVCAEQADLTPSPSHRSDADVARIGPATKRYVRIDVAGQGPTHDRMLALARAMVKDDLILALGDAVAIAPPGETLAEARKKVPRGTRQLLVRISSTEDETQGTMHAETVDETASSPRPLVTAGHQRVGGASGSSEADLRQLLGTVLTPIDGPADAPAH
jgi:hypothetical protein